MYVTDEFGHVGGVFHESRSEAFLSRDGGGGTAAVKVEGGILASTVR